MRDAAEQDRPQRARSRASRARAGRASSTARRVPAPGSRSGRPPRRPGPPATAADPPRSSFASCSSLRASRCSRVRPSARACPTAMRRRRGSPSRLAPSRRATATATSTARPRLGRPVVPDADRGDLRLVLPAGSRTARRPPRTERRAGVGRRSCPACTRPARPRCVDPMTISDASACPPPPPAAPARATCRRRRASLASPPARKRIRSSMATVSAYRYRRTRGSPHG